MSSYDSKEIKEIDVELNINKGKSTKYFEFIDNLDNIQIAESYAIDVGDNILNLGEYEIILKVYYKGKKIKEEKVLINN